MNPLKSHKLSIIIKFFVEFPRVIIEKFLFNSLLNLNFLFILSSIVEISDGNLKEYMAFKHNIGLVWHKCPHCGYRGKKRSVLKKHLVNKHDMSSETNKIIN